MKIITNTKAISRNEWLKLRRKGIGGSDAATVAGLNPYMTPFGLYLEKRGEVPEVEAGEAARWGNILENVIAQEFKERNELWVQRKNYMLQHDKHEFMIGNIDREIFCKDRGRGVLEIKTASAFVGKEWEGDEAPAQYVLQMQHYLAVTGYEYGFFAVLIGGQRYHQIEVERDQELIDMLIEDEAKFWERVKTGQPPAISGAEAESEVLKRLYPEALHREALPLESHAAELVQQRQALKEQEKKVKADLAAVENKLKEMLGEYEAGEIDRVKIEWKNAQRTGVDTKKLREQYPDIYRNVVKISKYRKFDIKEAR